MTTGFMRTVSEAVAEVSVRGSGGLVLTINAVIDTGFSQYLTLPAILISQLGLNRYGTDTISLADGSRKTAHVFNASIKFGNNWLEVLVEESEGDVILGMGLLYGHRLTIEVVEDGDVIIDPIG